MGRPAGPARGFKDDLGFGGQMGQREALGLSRHEFLKGLRLERCLSRGECSNKVPGSKIAEQSSEECYKWFPRNRYDNLSSSRLTQGMFF